MAGLEEDYDQTGAPVGDTPVLCVISRDLVLDDAGALAGLPPLSLEYWDNEKKPVRRVVSTGPGTTSFRVQWASSPYVEGEYPITAVRQNIVMPLNIRVYGNTQGQMESRVNQIMRAMEQIKFTLGISIGNVETVWDCWAANGGPTGSNGAWDSQLKRVRAVEYAFQIPRLPKYNSQTVT